MRDQSECCGLCARFVRKDSAQASKGLGWCTMFEEYKHCRERPEVLFKLADRGQLPERRAFIEAHKEETK